ncbi:MAG: ATP-binding cassette domain-containing protein [Gemmatimonadaceae bacterium]
MIEARGLAARVGDFELRDVSFTVPGGAYGVVIGPAGSGKTTLLEAIAGIVAPVAGTVLIGGRDVSLAAPEQRGIGFVYQHGYLFPHLSVEENIAYGARTTESAREAAHRFGADALFGRGVRALSGGERQIVAIARAVAAEPIVLLLDEPFGALDPRRRTAVRREVRALHRATGITVLQVTHDFTEAGLLGDVAILLDGGRVLQHGPPEYVFREPASPYIAEFLGAENVFAGEVHVLGAVAPDWEEGEGDSRAMPPGRRAIEFRTDALTIYAVGDAPEGAGYAVVRADEVLLSSAPPPDATSARNRFAGVVSEVAVLGAVTRVTIDLGSTPLVAALTTRSAREMRLAPGSRVHATFKAMAVHLC